MRARLTKMAYSLAAGPFAEPVMGLTMLMIGVALALPATTFELGAYQTLAVIAPEPAWAALFFFVGGAQLVVALLERRMARMVSAMTGGCIWMVWTAATLHAGSRGVLWAVGVSMMVGQALAYLRARAMPRAA